MDAIGAAVVLFGLALAVAAVVGGGFQAAGITFPPLSGVQRGLMGLLGVALIAAGVALAWFDPGQDGPEASGAGAPQEDVATRESTTSSTSTTTFTTSTTEPPTTSAAPSSTTSPTTVATTTTSSTTTTTPPATVTRLQEEPSPEDDALATLQELVRSDASTMRQLDEHWVPQLSAKELGLVWQGVYWDHRAILDEHYRLRATYDAILTDGATYNFRVDGEQMDGWFVTLVPTIASDPEPILDWCAANGLGQDDCFAKFVTTRQDIGSTVKLQP